MLPAEHRLRRRLDFETAIRHGRRAGRSLLVVHLAVPAMAPTPGEPVRAGFTVNRAVGSSVQRHAVVRRLRHLMRRHLESLPPGSLLVVRALPAAAEATSQELDADLDSALNTLLVDDLDAFLAGLAERKVMAGPVKTIGDGVRVTVVTDPDGNRLQVGQPPA